MVCTPLTDDQFNPGSPPPGFNIKTPQLPNLNIPFPPIPINDLSDLFNELNMILPPGILPSQYHPDILKDIFAGINSLLQQFMPFLMFYSFFLALLNLILCIIEIICSLTNPFKMIRAIRRLFRICIPEFLSLFPFFALILMIISLLLLLLALIEYLITRLLQLIETILRNILLLAKATSALNNDSIIGIVKKIGDLLCILQNLFIMFGVFNLIIQVIKAILSLAFRIPPCDSSDGSPDGCCTPDVCPAFLKDNTSITGTTGFFQYMNQVGTDSGLTLPPGFPPIINTIRNESWQFYDPNLTQDQAFINITKAFDLPSGNNTVFFPAGTNYNAQTSPSSTPYTIDFTVFYDPSVYGVSDPKGSRLIKIANAIVVAPPTNGVLSYDGKTFIPPNTGTLNLVGGVVEELDGSPILDSSGNTIPINTFFHQPINDHGAVPLPTDPVVYPNLSYTFNINHDILVASSLITLGCVPEVAADRDFINNSLGLQFNTNGINLANVANLLPDITGAQQCITEATTIYRQSISTASTNTFQNAIISCLNTLQNQTNQALAAAISAGFDQFKSNFSLEPNIQFTTSPIQVIVNINESSGTTMTNNLPAIPAALLANQLSAIITLGTISSFSYDGSKHYIADITSDIPGNGTIKVAFNNNFISNFNNPASIDQAPSITPTILTYTFVQSPTLDLPGSGTPYRDEGDVARS